MKLLIDQNLPPRLADPLTEAGHPAVHVRTSTQRDALATTDSDLSLR